MKYGSVCSGIEAASVAWESLNWEAQWYSEIEHFPSAVLAHRFPSVPNLGDMTKIHETKIFNDTTINLLVGGTPCQSFSVAGLRKGLTDPRGNLMLTFLSLAERKKPEWIVWENVPGVLSSNGGRDFATFLQALAELGYGFAYRVLDAQYFGVAQRRRRVFVVGYLGDWRPAGAVLFEQDCLSGNTKKSREKRKATTEDAQGGSGGRGFRMTAFGEYADDDSASTLKQRDYKDATDLAVEAKASLWNGEQTAATLTKQNANGAQRMPDKDNFGAVLQPVAVDTYNQTTSNVNQTIKSPQGGLNESIGVVLQPIDVDTYNYTTNESTTQTIRSQNDTEHIGAVLTPNISPTITQCKGSRGGSSMEALDKVSAIHAQQPTMAIRRLTPTECERLQGFPDGWTKIPYRNKPEDQCLDGPRYKACGNSMAVPVMRWIGERINMVKKLRKELSL